MRRKALFPTVAGLGALATTAEAGMGLSAFQRLGEATRLGVVTQLRLESLSFFTVVFLLLAWVMMRVWNGLRKDFPVVPFLSYPRALGLLLLWGLAMSLVLSMITGARELLTPGVWERAGALYRIGGDGPQSADEQLFEARQANLERLGRALLRYAEDNEGRFPAHEMPAEVTHEAWQSLAHTRDRYIYFAGRRRPAGTQSIAEPLAYEPEIYGEERLVLFTDGSVRRMTRTELAVRYLEEMREKFPELYRPWPER